MSGQQERRRRRREGVPDEHKLVSEGTRFAEILLPAFGVGNLRKQLNQVHYRLAQFVNETIKALGGVEQELTALCLMTTQNRMALDMLLAKEGGVCVMIGEQCCTYIPPNDSPDGNISKALDHMRSIADKLRQDELTGQAGVWNWFLALFSSWRSAFLACLPLILIVLIVICCLPLCCECVSGMIRRAVATQYQMLQNPLEYERLEPERADTFDLVSLFRE